MQFSKILSATAAVGIAGALALGATSTAHAATPTDTPVGTITGIGRLDVGATQGNIFTVFRDATRLTAGSAASEADAQARGARVTLPQAGKWGPIDAGDGKCLTDDREPFNVPRLTDSHFWADCNSSDDAQLYMIDTQGRLVNKIAPGAYVTGYASASSDHSSGYLMSNTTGAPAILTGDLAPRAETLTAQVDSVDADAMTAMLSGTGTAGDTITVTGPAGEQTVTVGTDGTWTATISGLAAGDNTITATDGTETVTVTATIMPSPIVNPMIAGGAGLAAVLGLGATMFIRRKTTA